MNVSRENKNRRSIRSIDLLDQEETFHRAPFCSHEVTMSCGDRDDLAGQRSVAFVSYENENDARVDSRYPKYRPPSILRASRRLLLSCSSVLVDCSCYFGSIEVEKVEKRRLF